MSPTINTILKDTKKLVFSKAQTMKMLRQGKLSEIFLSSNFDEAKLFENIAKMTDTKVNKLTQTNDEIGALCKKPYQISIIGLKK
ncbi:hypothetical protein HN777_00710 [Candidatus Woesearchaeota archaeon]|jgi:ribosomal protein L30E|nr:hypothetical protein [Candidatus Woesearchaeota archaeon]MBT7402293.1 hypothetical protein [Candidatus Woesearchaeota archaeon]